MCKKTELPLHYHKLLFVAQVVFTIILSFQTLDEVSPILSPDECIAGLLEENGKKNRDKNVYPGIVEFTITLTQAVSRVIFTYIDF